jgi:hypothetical protein
MLSNPEAYKERNSMKLSARSMALLLSIVASLMLVVPAAAQATASSSDTLQENPTPGVFYMLQNQWHGQCLAGRSNERVNISSCNPFFNDQIWTLEPVAAAGFYRLRVAETGKCVAIISNGNVRTSNCVDSFNDQWWRLDPVATGGPYMLYNHLRQTCLAATTRNGGARSFTCTPSFRDQWWTFIQR